MQAHDHALPVGRKARRETHAGKITDDFTLPGFDVEQINARIAGAVRHVGDLLRRRREARRQHQFVAAGEIAHVGAVLVHDREPLDAALGRPGLVDEHDAGVEVALIAGQALVDRIRNDVSDAPPIVGGGEILLAGELLARQHVPQPELGFQPSVRLTRDPPDRERLRVDGAPVRKARHRVHARDLFKKGGRIERREQAAALEIVGDDLRNAMRGFVVGRRPAEKVRDRDRHGLHIALRDVDRNGSCRRRSDSETGRRRAAENKRIAPAQASRDMSRRPVQIRIKTAEFVHCIHAHCGSGKKQITAINHRKPRGDQS